MLTSYVTSLIRTGSALLVGYVLSLPLAHPVLVALGQADLSPAGKEKLIGGLVAVLTALYYAAAHAAEKRWPNLTWLLGSSKQPAAYAPAAETATAPLPAGTVPLHIDLNADLSDGSTGNHAAPIDVLPDPPTADPAAMGGQSVTSPTTPQGA